MKKNILKANIFSKICGVFLSLGAMIGLGSCTETIDESNFAIKTEQTIADYLSDNLEYSSMKAIFERVTLGDKSEASSIMSVLSARGNYTLFLPNDSSVNAYVESLGKASISELSYAEAKLVAYSCLIDNGTQSAYETADFPSPGSFALPNLNDRLLTCEQDASADGVSYIINGTSRVQKSDIEVSNGMIHQIETVLAPSTDNLADMIAKAENLQFMSYLLSQTNWKDSLVRERDEEYEKVEREATYYQSGVSFNSGNFKMPQHRYLGFTAFVETDEVFAQELGVALDWQTEKDEDGNDVERLTDACKNQLFQKLLDRLEVIYPDASNSEDYTHPNNALNRFVGYHLLHGRMAYDHFVIHYNEYEYGYKDQKNPQSESYPVNVWDYYTTMGQYRGLIKITQVGDEGFEHDLDHKIYLNRISEYDDSQQGNYRELGVKDAGILISPNNGSYDNNAQNGFYYPINKILFYSDNVKDLLGNERIRIDLTTMLPELMSNNYRFGEPYIFPNGYFENIFSEASDMHKLYLCEAWGGWQWRDYQGDEFLMTGLYDFILRLPPVPKDGTYELRMGVSANELRGMCQIYFGSDPQDLPPVGLPFDMRLTAGSSYIPWEDDVEDESVNAENDKNMRNQNYMKSPKYFQISDASGQGQNCRENKGALRRIVTTSNMEANKTYYLRFKTALKKLDAQFFIDYFEFVPTSVYNGVEPEDIW